MKLAIIFDLMLLRDLLMLIMCVLESLMNFFTFSILIETMTCLQEGLLVVMLIYSLGLLLLLMIF